MGSSWAALPTLAVLAAAYVLSQFFRTALAVVAPEIAADLGLDPARLGMLSSAWFWAFAAAQIPIGVALDRWGPRRTVSLLFGVGGLGCLVFARATQLGTATLGQILIGIGCAPVFMGALVILARFYPPHLFAQFSAILLAIGTAGTLAGTTPLALVAGAIGWRGAFLGMGALVVLVALLLALVVRDRPPGAAIPTTTETLAAAVCGLVPVLANRRIWAILPMCFTGYAVLITVRGLWAGPYLAEMFAFSPVARGNVLLAMSVAMILGNLAYGMLERRYDRRRRLVAWGSGGVMMALLLLAGLPAASAALATAAASRGRWPRDDLCAADGAGPALPRRARDRPRPDRPQLRLLCRGRHDAGFERPRRRPGPGFRPGRDLAGAVPVPGGGPGGGGRHLSAQRGSAPYRGRR